MNYKEINERLYAVTEYARASELELRRTIQRVEDGDTIEMVRAVVQRVTEDMECIVANYTEQLGEDGMSELIETLVNAKFDTFEKVTGHPFDTESNRAMRLRKEIREAKT